MTDKGVIIYRLRATQFRFPYRDPDGNPCRKTTFQNRVYLYQFHFRHPILSGNRPQGFTGNNGMVEESQSVDKVHPAFPAVFSKIFSFSFTGRPWEMDNASRCKLTGTRIKKQDFAFSNSEPAGYRINCLTRLNLI